ncbi:MAG: AtpZ/AtpI family protein [Gammaproteobacteria bacterium]|nr:AtpZ/AtpI family protein [Gammaproteobacteria bacterium]
MRRKKREPLPLLQTGVGTVLSSMAISGFILGFATDQIADTTPFFMLIFGFLGVIGGTMKAHKFLMMVPGQKKIEQEQKQRREKHTTIDD